MTTGLKKRASEILGEEQIQATLNCGLPVVVVPKPGLTKKIAIVATRYGSIDLVFDVEGRRLDTPPGIAHFLEHQLFKKEGKDVLAEFGRFGASSNAQTDYTSTAYYFTCSERFFDSLEMLLGFTFSASFQADGVSKEKLIIEQELRMYEDSPDYKVYKNLMTGLYQIHPVRIDVGGTVESIQLIDPGLLDHCYRVFYHPRNMVLVVAGDVDAREIVEFANRKLPSSRGDGPTVGGRTLPVEPPGVAKAMVWQEQVVSRPRVLVGTKDLQIGGKAALDRDLASSVMLDLLFGRSSEFYQTHYESGLIDDSFSFSYNSETPFGFSLIGGESDDPEKLAEEILKEIDRARLTPPKAKDIERSKKKRLGRFLRAFDTPDGAAFLHLGYLFKEIDIFSVPKAIAKLSPGAIMKRMREHFDSRNYAISVVAPKKEAPQALAEAASAHPQA